ncbi:histone-like nucleoid-structuring protein Lsr2 [Amycolatopsis sp. CA-230715]|uniref:histone-like nucleoid-structuring protein Lsr2 n=1 Tax=Amycolatopsis sp. CA-230715 TaxID=2745196 RepID=UPI001C01D047|nr:Lsr2 family protein [Amycolatopsis sp. CA-230715]QWF77802.1 Nucleoid-associated protein Lsr2 [Amycolatopsis sp. CA-230715]
MVDDLDGSEADETIQFELDGTRYRIDLSAENAKAFRALLARYVEAGRYLRGYRRKLLPGGGRAPSGTTVDNCRIRHWARVNGLPVSERGVLPTRIVDLYERAEH